MINSGNLKLILQSNRLGQQYSRSSIRLFHGGGGYLEYEPDASGVKSSPVVVIQRHAIRDTELFEISIKKCRLITRDFRTQIIYEKSCAILLDRQMFPSDTYGLRTLMIMSN